jgi:hypothetical protein
MTASFWSCLLTLGVVCPSCGADQTGRVAYQPVLKQKLEAYMHSSAGQADSEKVLSVQASTYHDTVLIKVATAYPDRNQVAVIGHDTLGRFHLFFVGEPLPAYYYIQAPDPQAAEIALKTLLAARYGGRPLPGFNYHTFFYWFVNKQLVKERSVP